MDRDVWSELQIPETNDVREIRRAYAQRLRHAHPEDDAEGFKRLRAAYEEAMFWASIPQISTSKAENIIEDAGPSPLIVSSDKPPSEPSLQEQAYGLVQDILTLSSSTGELAAAKKLIHLLHSDELQNIELKGHVEEVLIDSMVYEKSLPFVFLNEIAGELRWDRNKLFVNDFSNKGRLLERLEGWRAFRNLVNASSSPRPASVTRMQAKAASMVLSAYDPWRFYMNRILHIGLAEAVQNRIDLLQTDAPSVEEHLDSRTLEWWAKRKVRGSSLTVLIVIIAVTLAFVINNFRELPSVLIPVLALAVVLFTYAVWKKWPTIRTLSKPKERQSYLEPLLRVFTIPVALMVMYVLSALPLRAYLPVIVGIIIISIVRSRRRS